MPVLYKERQVGTRRVDFLVDGKVVVELKAISGLENVHLAQAINYLEAFGLEVVTDPVNQRVLDPSCVSGTFIAECVEHFLEAAKQQKVPDTRGGGMRRSRRTWLVWGFSQNRGDNCLESMNRSSSQNPPSAMRAKR